MKVTINKLEAVENPVKYPRIMVSNSSDTIVIADKPGLSPNSTFSGFPVCGDCCKDGYYGAWVLSAFTPLKPGESITLTQE